MPSLTFDLILPAARNLIPIAGTESWNNCRRNAIVCGRGIGCPDVSYAAMGWGSAKVPLISGTSRLPALACPDSSGCIAG